MVFAPPVAGIAAEVRTLSSIIRTDARTCVVPEGSEISKITSPRSALRGDVIFDISLPSGTTHVRASVRMMDDRVLTSAAMPATGGAKTIDLFDFEAFAI